jgi:hypothetical protein
LARERGYLHHFVHPLHSERDTGTALRNLGVQLIRAWDLKSVAIGGVLPAKASNPDFFDDLLHKASEHRDQLRPGEPIVIVVDGLTEVEPKPAPPQNVLGLPAFLPNGVYLIVSQRNTYVPLGVKVPRHIVKLSAARPENFADMRTFLEGAAEGPAVRRALDSKGIAAKVFVESVLAACGGVWTYLYYLMLDIEGGARSVTQLDTLPTGLWQYYAQYWQSWEHEHGTEWQSLHQPLLNTLAAAREQLPARLLGSMAGIEDEEQVSLLLEEAWRPFLQVDDTGEEYRYGIFHVSLRDFMEGQVDLDTLRWAEKTLVRRMASATKAAHSRIADRYLSAWGGLNEGLPGLRRPANANRDGGYGVRHLAEHLIAADRGEELHRLLWIAWRSEAVPEAPGGHVVNAWREAHESSLAQYVNDVSRAWALAEKDSKRFLAAGEAAAPVVLELRYALLTASVNSLAANIPPALLLELMRRGKLASSEAVTYARRGPDPLSRSEALLALGTVLPEPQRSDLLLEALGATSAIDDEQWRTGALARIAPYLAGQQRPEADAVAMTIVDEYWRAAALGALDRLFGTGRAAGTEAPARDPGDESWYSPELAVPHALAVAHAIEHRHAEVLARLTARLPAQPQDADFERALEAVRPVPHDRWRSEALTALALLLSGGWRDQVLLEALDAARAVGDSEEHGQALSAICRHLAALQRPEEAIATAKRIPDPHRRAKSLAELAESVAGSFRSEARRAALQGLEMIPSTELRADVLVRHPALCVSDGRPFTWDAGTLDAIITDEYWRGAITVAVVPFLDAEAAEQALHDAFERASSLSDPHRRADLLARLAPQLPTALIERAAEQSNLSERDDRGRLCAALASRLVELGRVDQAVTTALEIEDEFWRAVTLKQLAAMLSDANLTAHALRVAGSVPYLHWQAEALARVAVAMEGESRNGVLAEALALARSAEDDGWKAETLAQLAGYLDNKGSAFEEALEVANRLKQPHARWRALASIAGLLAAAGLGQESIAQIDRIDDPYCKADALVGTAALLPPELLSDALSRASGIEDPQERARVFSALLPRFEDLPAIELHAVWSEAIHLLGTGTRQDLLLALPGLLPSLSKLGGPEAMVECAEIVESVRRWWP